MRILFVNPRYDERQYRYKVNKLCPPLGISYLTSIHLDRGHTVNILDMEALEMDGDALADFVGEWRPELIGFHTTTPVAHFVAQYAAAAKAVRPEATVVIGGPHATLLPEAVFTDIPQADYLLRGEAEGTICDFVDALESQASPADMKRIAGIGFPDGDDVFISEDIPHTEDLDDLPMPAFDLLPLDAYHEGSTLAETGKGGRAMTMLSSRGCPHSCIFCCAPVLYGHKYRARSPENVVAEMKVLVETYDVSHIVFYDASFMADTHRVEGICRAILDASLKVTWRARCRADKVSEPLLALMKEAGCTTVAIGVETGSQRLLEVLDKKTRLEDIEKAFEIAHKVGLWTVGYFILGIPTETPAEAEPTIEFAKKLDPDWALFTHATPLPGTQMAEMTRDQLITDDWSHLRFSANSPVIKRDNMSEQDEQDLMDHAFRAFYLRKDWLKNRLAKATTPVQTERIIDSFFYYYDKTPTSEAVTCPS